VIPTAVITLKFIKRLVFVMKRQYVFCEVCSVLSCGTVLFITLQVAILIAIVVAIICGFGESEFDSSPFLFGRKVQSSLGMVLGQGGSGDAYPGGQRGSLSPGTYPNVNCC
jgi:hypothetical protein